jgi:hypothetical protein
MNNFFEVSFLGSTKFFNHPGANPTIAETVSSTFKERPGLCITTLAL